MLFYITNTYFSLIIGSRIMFYMSYLTILCRLKDIPAEIQKKTLSGKSKVIFFLRVKLMYI